MRPLPCKAPESAARLTRRSHPIPTPLGYAGLVVTMLGSENAGDYRCDS